MAFEFIRREIDSERAKDSAIVDKRREAGRRSAEARRKAKSKAAPAPERTEGSSPVELIDDAGGLREIYSILCSGIEKRFCPRGRNLFAEII